ncbi:hypothetical protein [Acidocella sp. KAb 2-4]|uniref:hypothetical protein n=1 Tax=Acidocella sp. KAb 2-4 TaxID=2885158 RepID=UPI001D06A650|nr:hypothetical protein [Acidocella sp. KAb 2-4]MCB5943466.1 hypothetical protein [Acidocella sp. KAb 2-4]
MSAADIHGAVEAAIGEVPGCLAAAYLDLAAGVALHMAARDALTPALRENLPLAWMGLFTPGPLALFDARLTGASFPTTPRELIVNGETSTHLFLRGRLYPDYGAVFVCAHGANFGYTLYKARAALARIEAALQ